MRWIHHSSPYRAATLVFFVLVAATGCGDRAPPRTTSAETYDSQGRPRVALQQAARPPNLIFIIIDSLRADALPPVDSPHQDPQEARMPFLASLAKKGVRFENAVAAAPWTLPSMVSMFTGLLPSTHGQYQPLAGWHLPDAVTTYPEILQAAYGYETAALVVGPWFQHKTSNLLQGFATHREPFSLQNMEGTVGRWDKRRDKEKPFFLVLHAYEAHEPYGEANHPWPPVYPHVPTPDPALLAEDADPAELTRAYYMDGTMGLALNRALGSRFREAMQRYKFEGYAANPRPELADELQSAYWDGVRWTDGLLEAALERLEQLGLMENTLLVITADHGETFGAHGNLGHGLTLYDDLVRVPLVMIGPPPFDASQVIDESIGLVDVLPTFLDWAGAQPLKGVDGRSALGLVKGDSWCRPVVSEERLTRSNTGTDIDAARISVRTPAWKYIVTYDLRRGAAHEEAYDLTADPQELVDLGGGTGRLPDATPFDACACPVIEGIRDRIWDDAEDAVEEPYSIPYGAAAPRVSSKRPTPCATPP